MGISRVQFKSAQVTDSTTLNFSLTSAPTNGNILVAVIATSGSTIGRVSSITETGATWSRQVEVANANGVTVEIWAAFNVSGASASITLTLAAILNVEITVAEYSGLPAATGLLDKIASATGNSISLSSGATAMTTRANELFIAGFGIKSTSVGSFIPGSGWTNVDNQIVVTIQHAIDQKIASSTQAAQDSASFEVIVQYAGAVATFKGYIVTDRTQTGKARLQAKSDKTQAGIGRIQAKNDKTQAGKSRLQATTDKTQSATARMQAKADKIQAGIARIQVKSDKIQAGIARIQAKNDKTQTGKSRLQTKSDKTESGVTRIQTKTDQLLQALARIQAKRDSMQPGAARIVKAGKQDQAGKARIGTTTDRSVMGAARIGTFREKGISGVAAILVIAPSVSCDAKRTAFGGPLARTIVPIVPDRIMRTKTHDTVTVADAAPRIINLPLIPRVVAA